MSEHKSWLWRKKSSDKATAAAERDDPSSKAHEQEIHVLLTEKAELERDLRELNEKLAFTASECNENEELAKKNAKTAQEALAGWEKAEAKVLSLKEELSEALEERIAGEDRTRQLEAALKECMQQLRFVREEQEQRIHSVLERSAKEYEQKRSVLESELLESHNKIVELDAELYQLSGALLQKDRFIEDLTQLNARAEDEIKELVKRAESAEKTNASLKYEVRILEKELEIRNEEREFNRRTADATHKQHLENSKKIAKLESECQRLRVLVRKRLPGPAALAKMKNEVDVLERGSRRSRLVSSNGASGGSNLSLDSSIDLGGSSSPDSPRRKINVLVEKLCALEEENHGLKETLLKMTGELQVTKSMFSHAAMKLTQVESQLDESSKAQMMMELSAATPHHDFSMRSDVGSEDKESSVGWVSTVMSELDQFKEGKEKGAGGSRMSCRSNGTSEINLLDDFVEMEKLALVAVDKPTDNASNSETENNLALAGPLKDTAQDGSAVEVTGREMVPVLESVDVKSKPKLEVSISKMIQIIEGIKLQNSDCDRNSSSGYTVRLLQWKTSELASMLQEFLHCCYDALNGRANFEIFAQMSASTLEWMINHCFSLQDVSSMKDAIKKQLDWDEARSECELEVGIDKLLLGNREPPPPPLSSSASASPNSKRGDHSPEELQKDNRAEILRVKDEMRQLQSSRRELKEKLGSVTDNGKLLSNPPQTENNLISNLKPEDQDHQDKKTLPAEAESDEAHEKLSSLETETDRESEKLAPGGPILQLQFESPKRDEAGEEHADHEEEKQVHTDSEIITASKTLAQCQETILNLGKQLKALAAPQDASLFEKVTSSPTSTAEAVEAEKALTPTLENISIPNDKRSLSQRPSLLDRMLADDDDGDQADPSLGSPKTKEIVVYTSDPRKEPQIDFQNGGSAGSGMINQSWVEAAAIGSLAIVPSSRRHGKGGLWKKLLWRKKARGSNKKVGFPFAT